MQKRLHPLKQCDVCGKMADEQGGVQMKIRWYCGGCWIKNTRNGRL